MHPLLKRPVESVFSSPSVRWMARHRVRDKRLILAYHGVIPDGANARGERALFMAQRDFASHLDLLSQVADVAPLDRIDEEGNGRPRVAITLDDAYRGALREGVGELVKRGQVISYMGTSGMSTGYHLHYEVWHNGQALNPMKFVKADDVQDQ